MTRDSRRSSAWPGIAGSAIRRRGLAALLSLALLVALSPPSSAQRVPRAPPCDKQLVKPSADPLAYGPRGERCEGVYIREVSGTGGLSVVSFTTALQPFRIQRGKPLLLEWEAPSDAPVTVRAMSLRRKLYYRMDAERPAGAPRFEWPTDVLVALGLTGEELGLVGWTRRTVGASAHDVYVPLRVAGGITSGRYGYVLWVVPGAEVRELLVTLAAVDRSGRDEAVVVNDEPLKRGPYPAERAIQVRLPMLARPGLYRLQLNALLASGAPSSRSLYFQHKGG